MPPDIAVSSLTATSVNISWTQPEFSLPVSVYTVSLARVTGHGQLVCTSVEDNRPIESTMDTSMTFSGLEEFSTYMVTIGATFNPFLNEFSFNRSTSSSLEFTTHSAGK